MSRKLTNEPIRSLEEGDSITGYALLTKKERRQDKNGREYLDMELVDASGAIVAKVWSDSPALDSDFGLHDFVAYKGLVTRFRDQLQMNVKQCRRVTESDREHGFDESSIIPSTRYDIDALMSRLEEIYADEIDRPELAQLAAGVLETYGNRLREHPAAKTIHHAYRGGLLEHVVSMAELALKICSHYPDLDRDLILIGVLFHDLGKLEELGAMPANDYTTVGRLVGHVILGRDLLREQCRRIDGFPAELQMHLEHLVLSHQGRLEFGSPVQPMTAEAIALHYIDDLDSKLAQLRQAREYGEALQYFQGFGRYLYADPGLGNRSTENGAETGTDDDSLPEPEQSALDL